ncbi:RNA-binding protein [Candidatus Paraluminiphilus aquimaris]|uniref:Heat shock protein 15 n=1 Tax=Candidatus Paraluminiphilus aquimaris TaxID=2518994 RepID=A0ABY6Q6L7_9GAMM|nr:S4 domain-containing protein [Candidatus Paraluminiphilus aquimaris]UZP74068.1 RNA-binding protein [Candidatus Paraluminiphilus aquimaris]
MERLRVDKWLWAARFYKTRSIAKAAIEGGKVHLDGQRVKVSREITIGERLAIKQGWEEKEVIVKSLSDQRGPAPVAQMLYEETPESVQRREREAQARKAAGGAMARPVQKPGKHERKALEKLRKQFDL